MARPTFSAAPPIEDIAALDPLDRATRLAHLSREMGTLPPAHARLWRDVIRALVEAGHGITALAGRLDRSVGRISQLAGGARPSAPACAPPAARPAAAAGGDLQPTGGTR